MAVVLPEMMNIEMLNKTILCYAETIYRFNGLWEGPNPLTPLISLFLIQLTFSMGVIHLLVFALKPFNQPPFVAEVLTLPSEIATLQAQITHLTEELSDQRSMTQVWQDKCHRAEEHYKDQCAQLVRREAQFNELARRSLHGVASGGKSRADQEKVDELHARLLQAEEELEVASGQADRVIKDHERIVEEHAEYEEILRRKGKQTISGAEARTRELLDEYRELKAVCGPKARELLGAFEMLKEQAEKYKTVLARRPKLQAMLARGVGAATRPRHQ